MDEVCQIGALGIVAVQAVARSLPRHSDRLGNLWSGHRPALPQGVQNLNGARAKIIGPTGRAGAVTKDFESNLRERGKPGPLELLARLDGDTTASAFTIPIGCKTVPFAELGDVSTVDPEAVGDLLIAELSSVQCPQTLNRFRVAADVLFRRLDIQGAGAHVDLPARSIELAGNFPARHLAIEPPDDGGFVIRPAGGDEELQLFGASLHRTWRPPEARAAPLGTEPLVIQTEITKLLGGPRLHHAGTSARTSTSLAIRNRTSMEWCGWKMASPSKVNSSRASCSTAVRMAFRTV